MAAFKADANPSHTAFEKGASGISDFDSVERAVEADDIFFSEHAIQHDAV